MIFKTRRQPASRTIKDPIQGFDDFLKSEDFRQAVKQSDLDQKEMIARADKIERARRQASTAKPAPSRSARPNKSKK